MSPGAVRSELDRVLSSRPFTQSGRLSRFLRFVVESTLDGRSSLNEYAIGLQVFDKDERFDPRIDPIVRVHARRVRERLARYYETEGANDPLEISLPSRTYVPSIRRRRPRPPISTPRWSAPPEAANSIAVLPIASLSSEKEDEFFADGLTAELSHRLVNLKDLRVVLWASASIGAGRRPDIRQLGKELRVQAVLDGTVRKAEGHWRISVRLLSTTDGSVLWSNIYDADPPAMTSAQEQLARAICGALRLRIETHTGGPMQSGTAVPEAYQLYLRGRYQCNRRTREGLEKSVGSLTRAVALDGNYASAHAALAEAFVLFAAQGEVAPREVMPKAKAEALLAVECDPTLPASHVWLGAVAALYDGDLLGAELSFRRAIDVAPNSPEAREWYSNACLALGGRVEEALAHLQHAQDSDPLSLGIATSLAYLFYVSGLPADALRCAEHAIDLEPAFAPTHWALGLALEQFGRWQQAIAELDRACELSDGMAYAVGSLGHACAVCGQTGRAFDLLKTLQDHRKRRYIPATDIGLILVGLGQIPRALGCFEQAYEDRCTWLGRLKIDPRLKSLQTDRQFVSFFKKISLPYLV